MVSVGVGSLYQQYSMAFDGGALLLPFPITGHVSTVSMGLLLMRMQGAVGKACALAQDRSHTGKGC